MAIVSQSGAVTVTFGQIAQAVEARARGLSTTIQRAEQAGQRVVAVYNTQRDARVRPSHRIREGLQWDIDDPEMLVPPTDPNCRCYLTFHATDDGTAQALGIPLAPTPVTTPEEGLRRFARTARQQGTDQRLTPEDLYGPTRARLLEQGKIDIADIVDDETGDMRPVTVLQSMAAARGARQSTAVAGAMAQLETIGVSVADVRTIRALAARAVREGASPSGAVVDAFTEFYGPLPDMQPTQRTAFRRRAVTLLRRALLPYLEGL